MLYFHLLLSVCLTANSWLIVNLLGILFDILELFFSVIGLSLLFSV